VTLGNHNGTDGQTDGQTECDAICGPLLGRRATSSVMRDFCPYIGYISPYIIPQHKT